MPRAWRTLAATGPIALIGLGLALGGCAGGPRRAPPAPAVAVAPTYVVQAGDTLYSIATRRHLDYHDLARWNHLDRDYALKVGQVLVLAPPAPGSVAATVRPPSAAAPATAPPAFVWPAEGTVLGVTERPNGGFGLRIGGAAGAPIRAAAAGRVVYRGSGLRAYGLLVIIRHDEHTLTAYGNNGSLAVEDGQEVTAGTVIGTMGKGTDGQPMLYFEIRRDGRPVNPLDWLPPRR